MLTFQGSQTTKDFYMERLQAHYIADEFIHGTYWKYGKGCAVGCTVHSYEAPHLTYARLLGVPTWVPFLEDNLFEGMSNSDAKEFPLQFLGAIHVGIDEEKFDKLSKDFLYWLLTDPEYGAVSYLESTSDEYHILKSLEGLIYGARKQRFHFNIDIIRNKVYHLVDASSDERYPIRRALYSIMDTLRSTTELYRAVVDISRMDEAPSPLREIRTKHIADKFVTMLAAMAPAKVETSWVDDYMKELQQPRRVLALIQ